MMLFYADAISNCNDYTAGTASAYCARLFCSAHHALLALESLGSASVSVGTVLCSTLVWRGGAHIVDAVQESCQQEVLTISSCAQRDISRQPQ